MALRKIAIIGSLATEFCSKLHSARVRVINDHVTEYKVPGFVIYDISIPSKLSRNPIYAILDMILICGQYNHRLDFILVPFYKIEFDNDIIDTISIVDDIDVCSYYAHIIKLNIAKFNAHIFEQLVYIVVNMR